MCVHACLLTSNDLWKNVTYIRLVLSHSWLLRMNMGIMVNGVSITCITAHCSSGRVKSAAGCPACTSARVYRGYVAGVASESVHDKWILPSGNKAFQVMHWIIPPECNPLTISHSRKSSNGRTSIILFNVWEKTSLLQTFAESVLKWLQPQTRGSKPEDPIDLLRWKMPSVYYEIAGYELAF